MSQTPKIKESPLLLGYAAEADIRAMLELAGMLAKANGRVSATQIQEVERFMQRQIPTTERQLAIESFRKGKEMPVLKGVVTTRAYQLYGIESERWLEPVQILDILLRVALTDGDFTESEDYILDCVRRTLGVHKRSYWILRDTLAERFGVFVHRDGSSFAKAEVEEAKQNTEAPKPKRNAMSREEALRNLGLPIDADEMTIKSTHRTLVKRFHPDLAEGAKGSDDVAKAAVKRFYEIQEAYEVLLG